jgi:hypothetical protein
MTYRIGNSKLRHASVMASLMLSLLVLLAAPAHAQLERVVADAKGIT